MLAGYIVLFCCAIQSHLTVGTSLSRSTNVQGPIFAETVWNAKKGPYILTGDFQVASNVALIIKPGTQVIFNGDFQILVKGRVDIQGTRAQPVQFIGGNSRKAMLLFKSTDLSQSTINFVHFTGPQPAIQLATESGQNQDPIKNSGTLEVSNVVVVNSKIQTNGYGTRASLTIVNGNINNSTIVGVYPKSEPILIVKSVVDSSTIHSDSYNYGIKINGSTIRNSQMILGCCDANIEMLNSRLTNNNVRGLGSGVNGPLNVAGCTINGLNVNLPSARTIFHSSRIRVNNGETISVGGTDIRCSTFIGNGTEKGIQISGRYSYNPSTERPEIVQSTFLNFGTAITVGADSISLNIERSNFIGSTDYNIYTESKRDITAKNNYWGVNRLDRVRGKIYDYYRNIEYGQVIIDPISSTRVLNDDC